MMCEFDISRPIPTTPPPPPSPISPHSHSLNHGTQSLAQRMQNDTCFKCQQQGHWAKDCPNKTPIKSQPSTPIKSSDVPVIQCQCGGGACLVLISKTEKNPGKRFYCCPGRSHGCGFFAWCDKVRAPMCPCGAGACSINKETTGPNAGRKYYACRILKGHGACPFFQWVDSQQGDGSTCLGSPQSMPNSNHVVDTANIDSGNRDDLSTEHMGRMEVESAVMDSSQNSPNFEASDISSPGNCDPLGIQTLENEQSVNGDIVMQEVRSWDPAIKKALPVSRLMSRSEIHRRQKEFWRQICAAGDTSTRDIIHQILSLHVLWWGRLAFPPSRCLTDLPPRPFFCGIFPTFDPNFVPKDMGSTLLLHNSSNAEPDNPSPQAFGEEAQPSSVLQEPSGPKSPPCIVQDNGVLEAYGQALLVALKSMDPLNHVKMSQVASATFSLLDGLSIDYTSFAKCVKEFIGCASRLAEIELSIGNDSSSQELMKQYNIEKVRYDNVYRNHTEAVDALTASNKKLQLLHEEASRIKRMLVEIEKQIPSCEAETSGLKTRVAEISEHLWESTSCMQVASEALELSQQKEEERSAAKAALEKARSELQL